METYPNGIAYQNGAFHMHQNRRALLLLEIGIIVASVVKPARQIQVGLTLQTIGDTPASVIKPASQTQVGLTLQTIGDTPASVVKPARQTQVGLTLQTIRDALAIEGAKHIARILTNPHAQKHHIIVSIFAIQHQEIVLATEKYALM